MIDISSTEGRQSAAKIMAADMRMSLDARDPLDVFGWIADRTGCGHIRIMLPLTELRARGLTTGWSDRLYDKQLPSVLIGQRVCLPGPSSLWQGLAAKKQRPKLVYETDDNLFDIDAASLAAHQFFSAATIQDNLRANARVADVVTVTTEALADVMRPHNPNVHVIPNYLPAWMLDHERPRREGKLVVGWGGSGTHEGDWLECGQQIRRYLDRAPANVELHVIGADYTPLLKFPRHRVRTTPWIQSVPDYWRAIDYDVAVIPLKPTVFNQSKSAIKFLEAAMLGIPAVVADAGPYSTAVQHGVTGFLVRREHEWGRYLRDLVNDPSMRAEIGANAKVWAASQTLEANASQWEKVLTP